MTSPFVVTLVPVAVICLATAIYAWRKHTMAGGTAFAVFMIGGLFWTVSTIGIVLQRDGVYFWERFQYFGIVLIPTAWFLFVLDYTARDQWLTRRIYVALSIPPGLTLLLLWTNEWHTLFYDPMTSGVDPSVALAGMAYGPAFWVFVTYSYALLLLGTALLVHLFVSAPSRFRVRIATVVLAVAAPVLTNLTYLFGRIPTSIDPTPYAFAVSGVLFGWALFDQELFDVPPIAPNVAHTMVFEQMADGVLVVDAGGYVVDYNEAAAALFGIESDPDAMQLRDVAPAITTQLSETADGQREQEISMDLDGRHRHYAVTVTPIYRERGRGIGKVLTVRDITNRKLREQRLNVLHRVLRHNVRQETNKILGHVEFLEEGIKDESQRDHARSVKRAANHLVSWGVKARAVEQTLDPTDAVKTVVALEDAVDAAVEPVAEDSPSVTFDVEIPEDTAVYAHVAIEKALRELIENAVEHNDQPEPVVQVTSTVDDQWVELTIRDNGPGIPPTERDVFDRELETPLEHGSGLGLWLVRWLVNASNGTISAWSSAGTCSGGSTEGTTVTIRLQRAALESTDDSLTDEMRRHTVISEQ